MYKQQDDSPGSQQQYSLGQGSSTSSFGSKHLSSAVYGIDQRLQGSSQNMQQAAARMQSSHQLTPVQTSSANSQTNLSHPTSVSPRMSATSTPYGYKPGFTPVDRTLPSKNITADNITDAFVAFILYCNPNFPLDVDTSTLRSTFQSPPKSDNKDFETFRLFELIRKFDAKEIKTWAQLALDLGVEAPDTSKGQSVQKVQQYSVRLKRWMRAMHIDAFFEFLLGKQHTYFIDVPHPREPYPAGGRDGVAAEEDLAIRALDPSFRPKRGRRRNSDTEQDDRTEAGSASKQPRLGDGVPRSAVPLSATPLSAYPDNFHDPWDAKSALAPPGIAPWISRMSAAPHSASSTSTPNPLRWQLDSSSQTPTSAHPFSAIPGPLSAHVDSDYDNEPRSAVTPSTRRKRRHGPAVSSAWPSANAPGSKPRGRPPANRNIQDGPFGTFPADPLNDTTGARTQMPTSAPSENLLPQDPAAMPSETPMFRSQGEGTGRPGRLSLQVPPREGAPVRLASPPCVVINGESSEREPTFGASSEAANPPSTSASTSAIVFPAPGGGHIRIAGDTRMHVPDREIPGFAFEVLRRVLASDLLRAELVGRAPGKCRLTGDEAKRLADAVLDRLGVPRADTDDSRDDIARLTAASWLGVGDQLNVPLGPAIGRGKRITITRLRTNADGFDEIVAPAAGRATGAGRDGDNDEDSEDDRRDVREVFDLLWNVSLGGCLGSFEMKGLTLTDAAPDEVENMHDLMLRRSLEAAKNIDRDGWLEQRMHEVARSVSRAPPEVREENIDWRARCKALEFAANIVKGEFDRYRQRVIDSVLDAVI